MDSQVVRILADIAILTVKYAELEDRVSVLETNTTSWDCRIEDLEDWQEKVDDHLDNIDDHLNNIDKEL